MCIPYKKGIMQESFALKVHGSYDLYGRVENTTAFG